MHILITGASSGIGYHVALILSRQGHTVYAIARSAGKLKKLKAESGSSQLFVYDGDITDASFINTMSKHVTRNSGRLDVLINNAGLLANKPFEKLADEDWLAVYKANVFAPVSLVKNMLSLLSKAGQRSHILNISSMGGFQGSMKFKGLSAYSSSKAALVGLTECLAEEFKDRNIVVNCLCLGSVQTEMFSAAFPGMKAATTVEEMADFIARFAITGQHLFNGKILPVSISTP